MSISQCILLVCIENCSNTIKLKEKIHNFIELHSNITASFRFVLDDATKRNITQQFSQFPDILDRIVASSEVLTSTAGFEYILFISEHAVVHDNALHQMAEALHGTSSPTAVYTNFDYNAAVKAELPEPSLRHCHVSSYDCLDILRSGHVGQMIFCRQTALNSIARDDTLWHMLTPLNIGLRLSELGPLHFIDEPLATVCENPFSIEHMQERYDSEHRIRERAIARFLAPGFSYWRPLGPLLELYAMRASKLIQAAIIANKVEAPEELDRQMFAYILLTAKLRSLHEGSQMAHDYFGLADRSAGVSHLFRALLSTGPDAVAGHALVAPASGQPPVVSVVTALHNQGQYIEETIHSVRVQTMPHWEMLIIDDGSTDASLQQTGDLLARLQDPRIRLVSQANAGKGKTRNRGVRETSAPFICVLDSDDRLCPEYFAQAVDQLYKNDKIGWVCPKTLAYGAENHLVWQSSYDFVQSLHESCSPVTSVYRREIWKELGGYAEDMATSEDWEFWVRAGEHGWLGGHTEQVLFLYRHAFRRFGCRTQVNELRKRQYLAKHPWWYCKLPDAELTQVLNAYDVCRFPPAFMNSAAMNYLQTHLAPGLQKTARKEIIDVWKRQWEQHHARQQHQ